MRPNNIGSRSQGAKGTETPRNLIPEYLNVIEFLKENEKLIKEGDSKEILEKVKEIDNFNHILDNMRKEKVFLLMTVDETSLFNIVSQVVNSQERTLTQLTKINRKNLTTGISIKEEDKGKINVTNSVERKVNNDLRTRRHRRSEWRRRWRPYGRRFSRSFSKSSRLDDLESRKNKWLNLRMHVLGQPLAPYNTTQFLMDDHNVREPEFEQIDRYLKANAVAAAVNNNFKDVNSEGNHSITGSITPSGGDYRRRCMSDSTPSRKNSDDVSSDDFYSSPDDELDFDQRQFFETYENIHAERISTMSKAELVKEYLLLEQKCEELETKLKEMEYHSKLISIK
uniref:Uncharacterized protein n=2 Tax=Tetranychus urticae TaxID=32264 RepID=T1KYB8_TETUR